MRNRILAVLLAVTMVFGAIPAQAAASETASTPVELTADAANFSVEIPTSLPVSVDKDGNVSVADNVVITNNSPAPVKLESMKVEPGAGWTLVSMSTDFSNKPVDTKELVLSLFGNEVAADGSVDVSGVDMVPGTGGAARASANVASVDYSAKCGVFRNAGAMTAAKVTSVIGFEVEEVAEPEPEALADYAVLYSDGTLAFQAGNEPKGGHGTVVNSWYGGDGGWLTATYTSISEAPWYGNRFNIVAVETIDKTVPLNTARWFYFCSKLTSLDITGLDTSNVTSMDGMFGYCGALTSLDVTGFDTSNVTNMCGMFDYCSGLTSLDVTGFDTNNVTNMSCMFEGCSSLTSLDVTSFDTSNVTLMFRMFNSCSCLVTIYASENFVTSGVTSSGSSGSMFYKCSANLVGGNGTKYSDSHTDKTYARIDLPGQPGYFTAKT